MRKSPGFLASGTRAALLWGLAVFVLTAVLSEAQEVQIPYGRNAKQEGTPPRAAEPTIAVISAPLLQGMKWDVRPILAACGVRVSVTGVSPAGLQLTIPLDAANRAGLERFLRVLDERESCLIGNMYGSLATNEPGQGSPHYRKDIRAVPGQADAVEVFVDQTPLDLDSLNQMPRPPGAGEGERLTLNGFMVRTRPERPETPRALKMPENRGEQRTVGSGEFPSPDNPAPGYLPSTRTQWGYDSNIDLRHEVNELRGVILLRRSLQEDLRGQ